VILSGRGLINTQECVISSVNVAELAARLLDLGLPVSELDKAIAQFNVDAIDFNHHQSLISAEIRPITRSIGFALGDRACLALAKATKGCAVTADRIWLEVAEALEVPVILIR
jgi:ribonuclease VapC